MIEDTIRAVSQKTFAGPARAFALPGLRADAASSFLGCLRPCMLCMWLHCSSLPVLSVLLATAQGGLALHKISHRKHLATASSSPQPSSSSLSLCGWLFWWVVDELVTCPYHLMPLWAFAVINTNALKPWSLHHAT